MAEHPAAAIYGAEARARLAAALACDAKAPALDEVEQAAKKYRGARELIDPGSDPHHAAREQLLSLARLADQLQQAIDGLGTMARSRLERSEQPSREAVAAALVDQGRRPRAARRLAASVALPASVTSRDVWSRALADIREHCVVLAPAAELAASTITPKRPSGRYTGAAARKLLAREAFIWSLADIFERATGRRATVASDAYRDSDRRYGPFLEFTTTAFAAFPELASMENDALGVAIQRALRARRAPAQPHK